MILTENLTNSQQCQFNIWNFVCACSVFCPVINLRKLFSIWNRTFAHLVIIIIIVGKLKVYVQQCNQFNWYWHIGIQWKGKSEFYRLLFSQIEMWRVWIPLLPSHSLRIGLHWSVHRKLLLSLSFCVSSSFSRHILWLSAEHILM